MDSTAGALVEEATRKSGLVWVAADSQAPRAAWHLWHAGCAWLVTGGLEQEVPGLVAGARAVVVVRSKDRQADRLVEWVAAVEAVEPGTPTWEEVVPLLHAKRLNPPDGAAQPERWARESRVWRLVPTGEEHRPHGWDTPAGAG